MALVDQKRQGWKEKGELAVPFIRRSKKTCSRQVTSSGSSDYKTWGIGKGLKMLFFQDVKKLNTRQVQFLGSSRILDFAYWFCSSVILELET